MKCPHCGKIIEEEDNGEVFIGSCYAPTLEGLQQHIDCCKKHYPRLEFMSEYLSPDGSGYGTWTRRIRIPNYVNNCPPKADRVCEKVNSKETDDECRD